MPWRGTVPAILQSYFGGQEAGNALAGVLFRDVNPSGKLPITYPASETAVPAGIANPTLTPEELDVPYSEGIFMGYRGYDQQRIRPLFPFGHGRSYTTFDYSRLVVDDDGRGSIEVSFRLENTGNEDGAEVAQVYVGRLPKTVPTPRRQLAGFAKVNLEAGERRTVTVRVPRRSVSYWSNELDQFVTPPGNVPVLIGSSSRDIRLRGTATIAD